MPGRDSLLALDPGLNNPAAALFRGGRLVAASRVKPQAAWKGRDIAERCTMVAHAVHDWANEHGIEDLGVLVVEWPQIYVKGRSKGDPNDLLPLVGVAMCLAGMLDVNVRSFKPAEWIGQCAKTETGDALTSPRGRLVWRSLDELERATVNVSHDAIDAVGIGLAALGRLQMRVYPGAT